MPTPDCKKSINTNESDFFNYRVIDDDDDPDLPKEKKSCCVRWKRCILISVVSSVVVLTTTVLVLLFAVAPSYVSNKLTSATLHIDTMGLSSTSSSEMIGKMTATGTLYGVQSMPSIVSSASLTLGRVELKLEEANSSTVIAHLDHSKPVSCSPAGGDVPLSLDSDIDISSDEEAAFSRFGHELVNSEWVHVSMVATSAIATVEVWGMPIQIGSVKLSKTFRVKGCEGLKQVVVEDFNVENSKSDPSKAEAVVTVRVFNPSNITADMGTLSAGMLLIQPGSTPDADIGTLSGKGMLKPGWTTLGFRGIIMKDDYNDTTKLRAVSRMTTQYMQGETIPVVAKTRPTASSLPIFSALLQGLKLSTTITGMQVGTMTEAHIDLTNSQIPGLLLHCTMHPHDCHLPTAIKFENPFNANLTLHSFELEIIYKDQATSYARAVLDLLVRGNATEYSPSVPVTPFTFYQGNFIKSLLAGLQDGMTMLGVKGYVIIHIGDLVLNATYTQRENIGTCITPHINICDKFDGCQECYGRHFFELEKNCSVDETEMIATCESIAEKKEIAHECVHQRLTEWCGNFDH